MAHMIDMTNNRANMAYVNETPWHGLGSELEPKQPIEVWLKAAGLDWTAKTAPAQFQAEVASGEEGLLEVPNRRVVYRGDTGNALGIVSDRYKLVQPAEVLEFFRAFVEAGDLELETAGSLAGGRRIWAMANLGKDFRLFGQDEVRGYLLLATAMDGSMATQAKFTSVRVVCQNTLSMADRDNVQPHVSVPHSAQFDAEAVQAQLGLIDGAWDQFREAAELLSQRHVLEEEALDWLLQTFGSDPEAPLEEQENPRVLKSVYDCVLNGPGANLKAANGTAWGLVNGATYYIDHVKGRDRAKRLDSAWLGQGDLIKRRALGNALKLVA